MLFQYFHRSGMLKFQASLREDFHGCRVDLLPAPAHRGIFFFYYGD